MSSLYIPEVLKVKLLFTEIKEHTHTHTFYTFEFIPGLTPVRL